MAFSMNTLIRVANMTSSTAGTKRERLRLNSKEIPPTEGTGQTSIGWS